MNKLNSSSTLQKILILLAIVAAIYNAVLFVIAGFEHEVSFWVSYIFMTVAYIVVVICVVVLSNRTEAPRDWLFGYPFYRHCLGYVVCEFFCSILFMALDTYEWRAAFIIQIIVFGVFIILLGSCFMARSVMKEVETKVAVSTSFIKTLLADVEMLVERAEDAAVKKSCSELCEMVRYSDPVSNSELGNLESGIAAQVSAINAFIACNDNESAIDCCKKAMLLITERNKKTKALK